MPYKLSLFGSLTLPQYEGANDVGAGQALASLVTLPGGGVFDSLGDGQAARGRRQIVKKGELVATSAANFRTQANALRAVLGKRDKLWREWDDGTDEWVYARLIGLDAERKTGNILDQEFTLTFDVLSPVWNCDTQQFEIAVLSASGNLSAPNDGNVDVKNAVLTINPASSVSGLVITMTGVELKYNAAIGSTELLVIDFGAKSVQLDGADAFTDFELGTNHAIEDWLVLAPGSNTITLTFSSGALTATITYYDGYH